ERSVLEPGVSIRRVDGARGDGAGLCQRGGPRGAKRALVLVCDGHRRARGRAADEITEQSQDHDRRHEQESQGAAVASKLLQESLRDGGDALAAHDPLSDRTRKASSRVGLPAWARISFGLPSVSSFPKRISRSRWQRSASSMTWLE